MSASSESVDAVTEWLSEHGVGNVTTSSPLRNSLSFSATISTANMLFNTTFHSFVHKQTNELSIRTLEYSIPQDLLYHIDVVHPTTSFGSAQTQHFAISTASFQRRDVNENGDITNASCNDIITPKCLQDLYGIPTTPATVKSNQIVVPGLIDFWAQVCSLSACLPSCISRKTAVFRFESFLGRISTRHPFKYKLRGGND